MAQSRQLAAIMFTDIVGYTSLMGEDELAAFELLKKNRAIQRPIIEKFNGKWLKEIGDGVLASFPTVTDAVYCAATIQKTCEEHPELKLRIGIHEGEVVFERDDVFGDGVNIASRLEPLAPIGGILVSESVHRNLGNKTNIESTFLREEQLKNVKEPIKIYSVQVNEVEPVPIDEIPSDLDQQVSTIKKSTRGTIAVVGVVLLVLLSYFLYTNLFKETTQAEANVTPLDKSIVVLPFTDLSRNMDQEYFSDGMMEEILNHLAQIKDLKVISRTTAMQYKGSSKSVNEITKELGVAVALEGSVRKDGDNLRITLQLIEGATDTHLWSESYDRQMTNIFQVQSDVAQRVAHVLQADISPETRISIETQPTSSTEAYDLYLLGRHFWYQRTGEGLKKSIDFFEQSIAKDSDYALAYSGLSDAYFISVSYGHLEREVGFTKAKQYAQLAQEIDPNLAPVQATLGTIAKREWNWEEAEKRLKLAIELDPNYVMARHWYAEYLFVMGPPSELLAQINAGLKIDPLSFLMRSQLADYYYETGDQERALEEYQRVLELDPNDLRHSYLGMFRVYLEMGNEREAIEYFRTGQLAHNYHWEEAYLHAYREQGMEGFIGKLLEGELNIEEGWPPFIAECYNMLGEKELALDWLEKAYESRIVYLPEILKGRHFDNLKEEPRYKELLEKIGIK
jgi:TolB-like protein/class 3 adenylate cyclase/tetratricopeptide (TPR) repeat protein